MKADQELLEIVAKLEAAGRVTSPRRIETTRGPDPRPEMSEKEFQAAVVKLAQSKGFICFHQYDSRRSKAGWPDLYMIQPWAGGKIIMAELKSESGKVSQAQQAFIDAHAVHGKVVHVWRPSDWKEIVEVLTR